MCERESQEIAVRAQLAYSFEKGFVEDPVSTASCHFLPRVRWWCVSTVGFTQHWGMWVGKVGRLGVQGFYHIGKPHCCV